MASLTHIHDVLSSAKSVSTVNALSNCILNKMILNGFICRLNVARPLIEQWLSLEVTHYLGGPVTAWHIFVCFALSAVFTLLSARCKNCFSLFNTNIHFMSPFYSTLFFLFKTWNLHYPLSKNLSKRCCFIVYDNFEMTSTVTSFLPQP